MKCATIKNIDRSVTNHKPLIKIKMLVTTLTPDELYQAVISELSSKKEIKKVHQLHKDIFYECCESVLNTTPRITDTKDMVATVIVSFAVISQLLKTFADAALAVADQMTLNYRGHKYLIDKNSPFIQDFKLN